MTDELNLSANQLDALREIGNVGAGNSATALSQVINRRIDMNVPKVSMVPLEVVPDLVGGPDAVVVGIFMRVYGKAPSNILFLLPQKSAFYLVDTLMGKPRGQTTSLDFMDESALMEIGNILSGAYLNAFFTFTQ
ncbi:MAG: chemotaxis protein CheC, partial [Selenomonas sp.]|nr:chemotaxis protein CheC [Selenomonas sp.]